jgi:hypothetical protein
MPTSPKAAVPTPTQPIHLWECGDCSHTIEVSKKNTLQESSPRNSPM